MLQQIFDQFVAQFKTEPHLVRAPGRINLIGEHTDYNLGYVLPAAVDKSLYFAIAKSEDPDVLTVEALDFPNKLTCNLKTGETDFKDSWGKYFKAIVELLQERGAKFEGVNCIFGGDIPIGAGMSSSAALCCGFIYGLSEIFDLNIPRQEIALIGQAAEHRIGLNCGLMDQYAVLFGKKDHALRLDCQSLEFEYFPLQLDSYSLVLINSMVKHELAAGSAYNDRRGACETAVAHIAKDKPEVKSLRDVSISVLESYKDQLDPLVYQRSRYVLDENQRLLNTVEALSKGDLQLAGKQIYGSHQGLSKEYEVSVSELDMLVDLAKKEDAVIGARMMGGGFGGCVINLMKKEGAEDAIKRITEAYQKTTGKDPQVIRVKTGNGVRLETLEK